jgi:hypothetical protein
VAELGYASQRRLDHLLVMAAAGELAPQLLARMVAPAEEPQDGVERLRGLSRPGPRAPRPHLPEPSLRLGSP